MILVFSNFLALMKRLRECVPLFVAATIVTALAQISVVGVAVSSVWISTQFILNRTNNLVLLFVMMFTLVAVHAVSTLFEVWWSHEVAYRILHTLRVHIYNAIERIAPLGLQGKRTGDVASAAMNDAEQLEWFYAHTASTAICAILTPTLFTGVLVNLIGPIGLIMLIPTAAMIAFPFALMSIQRRQGKKLRYQLAQLRIAVLDSIQGQRELRSLGMVDKQNKQILDLTRKVQNLQTIRKAWESAFSTIATTVGSTVLLVVLTGWVLTGHLDSALLPVAVVLAGLVPTPATTLVGMLGRVGEIGACAHRINTILNAKDPIPSIPETNHAEYEAETNHLVSDNTVFSYQAGKPVINQVSLTATPKRSIAIVGKSGAGKTTLANLAMRYLDPQEGELRFDGKNLRSYQPNQYRERLALVPQDCHIFAGTVRDNLVLANPQASDDDIWAALAEADISELITSLGGLDAKVGDRGTTLSGGERQRIGIARAFLRYPDMLILDEPLANIDPFLEASIAKNIRHARAERTTIVIAHRLASIRIADHIVVLDGGRVVAEGTHQELKDQPIYRTLLGQQIA